MSSTILATAQSQLILYGYSLFMIFGNIGNAFIVIIFSRQRQNACSIYLLSSAIVNILYLTFNGFIQIFPVKYIDETPTTLALCKTYTYLTSIIGQVAKTLIVLACIDRYLITSDRATRRAFSTPKRAKYLIFFFVIFWSLMGVHIPIMVTIVNGQCNGSGIYSLILSIYITIVVGLIPPGMSCIFGYLTYRNMRKIHNRVQPIVNNTTSANIIIRRDRDLLIIVISEVLVYIITASLFPVIRLETIMSQYILPKKSVQYSQIEIFISNIALLLLFANSATSFYTYLIASRSFREDFKQLIMKAYRKLRRQPVAPPAFRRNRT
jgi:hypothetical protein